MVHSKVPSLSDETIRTARSMQLQGWWVNPSGFFGLRPRVATDSRAVEVGRL
jgi:hypothetical protein